MQAPLLTSTRSWRDSKRKHGRRYPPGMKRMSVFPFSRSPRATEFTDPPSGSSYWTTAPSWPSAKTTALETPLTSSTSMPSPLPEVSRWNHYLHGSKSASLARCRSTIPSIKRPMSSTTGGLLLTLPGCMTTICSSKRPWPKYISGRCDWHRSLQHAISPEDDWRQQGHLTDLPTSTSWLQSVSKGNSPSADRSPPQHVDVLI